MKPFAIAAVGATLGLASTTVLAAESLPVTYVVYKLNEDGVALRKVEVEHGAYEAVIQAPDGSILKAAVDPYTADLMNAGSRAHPQKGTTGQPAITAAEAIQAVAETGYWEVSAVELEQGVWRIKARDDTGRKGKFDVDAATGAVR